MSTLPTLERELLHAAQRLTITRRPWHRGRRRSGLLALIGVAVAGAATAAATQMLPAPPTIGRAITPPPNPATPQHLTTRQATLDVLTQRASPTTTLPARMQANISQQTVAGENPRLGRKALTTPWGDTFWVLPAADGKICLLVNGGGGGCSPAKQIAGGTFNGVLPCHRGGAVYMGLLPTDATDASLTLDDASQTALSVTNNVWAARIPRNQPQPVTLNWTRHGAAHHAPTSPLPPPIPGNDDLCPH
jgi:hypothetical protein